MLLVFSWRKKHFIEFSKQIIAATNISLAPEAFQGLGPVRLCYCSVAAFCSCFAFPLCRVTAVSLQSAAVPQSGFLLEVSFWSVTALSLHFVAGGPVLQCHCSVAAFYC